MAKATETDWPFKYVIRENSILSRLPLQRDTRVAVLFDLGSLYLAVEDTVDLLNIDYNTTTWGDFKYKWIILDKSNWKSINDFLNDIQDVTNSLVVRVSA